MGKGIHWELCKKLKFDHTTKWFVQKPESALDFEIQTDRQIPARILNLMKITKNLPNKGLTFTESEKRQVLRPCQTSNKAMKYENDIEINCNWCSWNHPQKNWNGVKRLEIQRKNRDHPNYTIAKISQNTEECPGELRSLAVIQTLEKGHQLRLIWKNLQG